MSIYYLMRSYESMVIAVLALLNVEIRVESGCDALLPY